MTSVQNPPFFISPGAPSVIRGGFYDDMGGIVVGARSMLVARRYAQEVCELLNDHPKMLAEIQCLADAIDWVITDSAHKAPEQVIDASQLWIERLRQARNLAFFT